MAEKIDRKKYKEQIEKVYQEQIKILKESVHEATEFLVKEWGKGVDQTAIISFADILFQLKMGRKQNLAKVDQMIAMAKMQEKMQKHKAT